MRTLMAGAKNLLDQLKVRFTRNELRKQLAKDVPVVNAHMIRVRWQSGEPFVGPAMMPQHGWEAGSRQVRRAAIRTICFAQVTAENPLMLRADRRRMSLARATRLFNITNKNIQVANG
jgi:hypothetical protein